MKKTLSFLLAILMLLSLCACGGAQTSAAPETDTEAASEAPTEEAAEAPTEEATEAPTEEATEAPTEEATEVPTEEPTEPPTTLEEYIQATYFTPTDTLPGTYILESASGEYVNPEWNDIYQKNRETFHVSYLLKLCEDGSGYADLDSGMYSGTWDENEIHLADIFAMDEEVSFSASYSLENCMLSVERHLNNEGRITTYHFRKVSDYCPSTKECIPVFEDGQLKGLSLKGDDGAYIEGLLWPYLGGDEFIDVVDARIGNMLASGELSPSPAGTYLSDFMTDEDKHYMNPVFLYQVLLNRRDYRYVVLEDDGTGSWIPSPDHSYALTWDTDWMPEADGEDSYAVLTEHTLNAIEMKATSYTADGEDYMCPSLSSLYEKRKYVIGWAPSFDHPSWTYMKISDSTDELTKEEIAHILGLDGLEQY